MNKVFMDMNFDKIYKNSVFASIAHAIMVGEYSLLASEQSWDGLNYNFQDLSGGRGTISFSEGYFICVIQNHINYSEYTTDIISKLLNKADDKYIKLAREEALQYVLDDVNGEVMPVISTAFWGDETDIFSNETEEIILNISESMIKPLLFSEKDRESFWAEYYEMNKEQVSFLNKIYNKKIQTKGIINLEKNYLEQLHIWFDNVEDCIESFSELNINFNVI